ncbi:hypothetical protein TEA_010088 [Camellia sinensis var. sinensis]|uniref:Retinoblastoma-associated protein A-box domain-containing protein n=1 Tax=Camellia sinensis var. sinensis TaxID=542762 RepID=A0A4V3WQM0_CAMSN|nr:hypothetical protein TEA_010088 [Camellia sinensis var. sinensis]
MLFPAVLERTGITAFDLSKIIGSFIRHEKSLPRELKRHLNSLEERLLESMVWEKDSSMYNSLTVARPALSAETNHLCLLAEPMPSLDAIAMHMNFTCGSLPCVLSLQKNEISLVKDRLLAFNTPKSKLPPPALQSAFASPTRPNHGAGGETCAETAINVFFSKQSPSEISYQWLIMLTCLDQTGYDYFPGQCPRSPKISPFPSLPDMSPKKVSAMRNVYVSPLRSSKMDALISNGSKSYDACVGESIPLQENVFFATAKRRRKWSVSRRQYLLRRNRKLRGILNFDEVDVGLVSDSLVTNNLCLQNGSCASSSGAPVKSEQLESIFFNGCQNFVCKP